MAAIENFRSGIWTAIACLTMLATLALTGCKSNWIDAHIDNQTGQPVRELEVTYPSASFGKDSLAPGAAMSYRFQVRGSGPIQVDYTAVGGKSVHATGLTLIEHQEGQLTIRLWPEGKVEFLPKLKPAS